MTDSVDRVATPLVLFALACHPPAASSTREAPAPTIHVGANVQVSRSRATDTHYEVVVAAHPRDPTRLVVGSTIYPASGATYGTIVYASTDGGATWSPTLEPRTLDHTGDPAAAFGPDGTAYYVASSLPVAAERGLMLFRSHAAGAKWEGPFALTYMDREYVTVDATGGPFRGRVYVHGNNRVPRTISDFVVFRSSDSGVSFRGPGTRSAFGSVQASVMGNAVVASDGTLIGVYVEVQAGAAGGSQAATLKSIRSTDGGASLTPAGSIAAYVAGGERKGLLAGNANAEPALAIDAGTGTFKDRLYVVWPDRRVGHSEILFSWSADGGATWSVPRVINDNAGGDHTDQFMPEIAVNHNGVVAVTWYDRRNHSDNLGWDVRLTASFDGGASFLPSVMVSERGTDFPAGTSRERPRPALPAAQGTERAQITAGRDSFLFMGGDTAGLVADAAGSFHAVWVDNHTGVPQVWTALIALR